MTFIREINVAKSKQPDLILASRWASDMGTALEPEKLEALRRTASVEGKLVHVRVPVSLKHKERGVLNTFFDLFLKKTPDASRGAALYVRGAITVPDEARYFSPRQMFGALVATDDAVVSFLGDSENPAHTRWNGHADKLKDWVAASTRLSEIRSSLAKLKNLLLQAVESTEPDALKDLFSLKDTVETKGQKPRGSVPASPVPPITSARKAFRIVEQPGGFEVRSDAGLTEAMLPRNWEEGRRRA